MKKKTKPTAEENFLDACARASRGEAKALTKLVEAAQAYVHSMTVNPTTSSFSGENAAKFAAANSEREIVLENCLNEIKEQIAFMFADDLDCDSMAAAMVSRINDAIAFKESSKTGVAR